MFKGKSSEEIDQLIQPGNEVPAGAIAHVINSSEIGSEMKVNFTGAWDRFGPIAKAWTAQINRGKGFEEALFVNSEKGTFLYMPPFKIEALPTGDKMFLFFADSDSLYINKLLG